MSEVVIFSTGDLARWVRVYFDRQSPHNVVAFTVHREHLDATEVDGLPVVPFEGITESHPPARCSMFVAAGYRGLNQLRAAICEQSRRAGYELVTFVSPGATYLGERPGDNVVIAPGVVVQPYAKVGSGTVICAGTNVGHHAEVGRYAYIGPLAIMMGRSVVGDHCFVGAGATIRNSTSVGARSVIGAGAMIMKDAAEDSVYSVPGTPPREILSSELDHL
jgi:sugar O-acyltransferase (sialic acid O-acetyltransferase NeuD family)